MLFIHLASERRSWNAGMENQKNPFSNGNGRKLTYVRWYIAILSTFWPNFNIGGHRLMSPIKTIDQNECILQTRWMQNSLCNVRSNYSCYFETAHSTHSYDFHFVWSFCLDKCDDVDDTNNKQLNCVTHLQLSEISISIELLILCVSQCMAISFMRMKRCRTICILCIFTLIVFFFFIFSHSFVASGWLHSGHWLSSIWIGTERARI